MPKNKKLIEAENLLRSLIDSTDKTLVSEKARRAIEAYFTVAVPKTTHVRVIPVNKNNVALAVDRDGKLSIPSFESTAKKNTQQIRDDVVRNFKLLGVQDESVFSLRNNKITGSPSYSVFIPSDAAEFGLPDGYQWLNKAKVNDFFPKGSDEAKLIHLAILYAGCYYRDFTRRWHDTIRS